MLVIRLRKRDFAFHWLVAVLGTLAAWSLTLVSYSFLPAEITLLKWQLPDYLITSGLIFDQITWIYMLATMTLLLSALLTSAARSGDPDLPRPAWDVLSAALLFTAVLLLAIASGDILFLLITWTIISLFEIALWLVHLDGQPKNERLGFDFALRFVSLGCLIWALVLSLSRDLALDINSLGKEITPVLILGVALRLGIFPPFRNPTETIALPNITESVLRLSIFAPGLTLLTRVSGNAIEPSLRTLFFVLACIAALYAGFNWMSGPEDRTNLSSWSIGAGAFCLTAAASAQPVASMAWGITLLLAGGFIFHFKVRPVWLRPALFICILALTSLPLTPTSAGALSYDPIRWFVPILLLSQSLLVSGFLLSGIQPGPILVGPERWVWALYVLGLAVLPASLYFLAWFGFENFSTAPGSRLGIDKISRLLPGFFVVSISILGIYLVRNRSATVARAALILKTIFGFHWVYQISRQLIRPVMGIFIIANRMLEGQAGILWAFLLLVLFISLVTESLVGG